MKRIKAKYFENEILQQFMKTKKANKKKYHLIFTKKT